MRPALVLTLAALPVLGACSMPPAEDTVPEVAARWNHRPESADWNTAMIEALLTDGSGMVGTVPEDIERFCPEYEEASPSQRAAFYVAFFSGLARFESTWNPRAAGGGGAYQGLLQISPATARYHDCELGEDGLYDGASNLTCAVRIASAAVERDGVLVQGTGGVAADWPPMRNDSHRREVAAFTRALPQCGGSQEG
ncbi:transglycosylase SLT domain-containing protein [Pararhodobacter sp. CCB-MM2]|uniref:transglycosylase SLT domain-containing protein n=1 Tax=Pararhodobacter sp. CCB-MM2 TaxID=1786003 RepID=UPI001314C30F|nr:transglycosylase SLT domain-containing protein [Pararhodobacter sp. CCB-MM2]